MTVVGGHGELTEEVSGRGELRSEDSQSGGGRGLVCLNLIRLWSGW